MNYKYFISVLISNTLNINSDSPHKEKLFGTLSNLSMSSKTFRTAVLYH